EIQVYCLLSYIEQDITPSTDMRGVTYHHHPGITQLHFNGHMPHGRVAEISITVRTETTMDQSDFFDSGFCHALDCSCPKFQIRIYRIFNQHRNIRTTQCISYFLNAE